MKRVLSIGVTVATLLSGASLSAQEPSRYSLEQCIEIAIRNNADYRSREVQHERTKLQVETSRNAFLPTAQASLNQSWDFGRSADKTGVVSDRSSQSSSGSIGISWTIFSGFSRLHDLKSAKLQVEASTAGLAQARQDLGMQVTQRYFAYLHTLRVQQSAERQQKRSQEQADFARNMLQSGKWSPDKVADAEATEAQNTLNLVQASNNAESALLDLKQTLMLSNLAVEDIDLGAAIAQARGEQRRVEDYVQSAFTYQPALESNRLSQSAAVEQIKSSRSGYLPQLSLSAGYSNSYYKILGSNYASLNQSFSEQLRQNGRSYIGFNLSIPIFNAFRTRSQIRSAKLNLRELEATRSSIEASLRKEVETAYLAMTLAERKLKATEASLKASISARTLAEASWQAGRATSNDLSEASSKAFVAEIEHLNAQFDYILRSRLLRFYLPAGR